IPLGTDEQDCIYSNTFTIRWNQPPASDLEGYAWKLDYLGPLNANPAVINASYNQLEKKYGSNSTNNALKVMGSKTETSYINQDDGVWCFSVFSIDDVGNVSSPSSYVFKMNKYQPHTYITHIDGRQDVQGDLKVDIIGRGFSVGGDVQHIYFRSEGEKQNVRTLSLVNNDYTVKSDREIFIPDVENLPQGKYYVFVDHPLRGLAASAEPIIVSRSLTVKFGDYTRPWNADWQKRQTSRFVLDANIIVIAAVLILGFVLALLTLKRIGLIFIEGRAVQIEILALLSRDLMPQERKKIKAALRRRGLGLRFKLASFTIALVLIVVVMVSYPLYLQMSGTQQETLMKGLWDRSVVLIEGITASARVYMPENRVLELGYLPRQSAAVPEARYVTITGYGSGNTTSNEYVWASNDPDILTKIDTPILEAGVSRMHDDVSKILEDNMSDWNERAQRSVGSMAESIEALNVELGPLLLRDDKESRERLEDINTVTSGLAQRITGILDDLGKEVESYPAFNTADIGDPAKSDNTNYLLYKPIFFRQSGSNIYFRGTVRLEISSESIVEAMHEGQRQIFRIIFYIALAALMIGGVGSMALATIIILPIRRLVRHVERIRDTEDKSDLEGMDIAIKSKDELAVLGDTINQMTHNLVKAALAAQDLSIGKEIQKKFIPLDVDRDGNKLSSGFKETKYAQFFGYYEGAKGVSGDYFDYHDIDGRYFAIIKCDVAGKGIPAALIMIQVATMFINYFKEWRPGRKDMLIEKLVYQINEFIETLAFKGRFAAFTLCVFNSENGSASFCNAGDNIVHWFDASENKLKYLTLPETPATGVLPNSIIESRGGYTVQTIKLDPGDILFLYTDGIEEAKRKFRDAKFNEIVCTSGEPETIHGTHVVGQADEEMGPERVEEIVNSVMNKRIYSLYKYHNPYGDVEYHFDFTKCEGTVEEVIMAMVSVEKVFRIYKPLKITQETRVLVDAKIDAFLKEHFVEYTKYCSKQEPNPANPSYLYYKEMCEDEQYDDLTILGVTRK
ncbi:MAG: SpoIIE family protein phosphatase, partial [Spirochaetaceae bacterium]|nr:SpoIIE family protein phosphatase [Spirochaetaceae bacterium]